MAQLVAAFGSSHSTMLFSAVENWQTLFDHVDCKAPISDFDGTPPGLSMIYSRPRRRARPANISSEAIQRRHQDMSAAMDRLDADIAAATLDVLIIVGDDQREIFKDACRPAIGVYYGTPFVTPRHPGADRRLVSAGPASSARR